MDATNWEKVLIGIALWDQALIPNDVQPMDFAPGQHREIWKEVMDLSSRSGLSPRSLIEALRSKEKLDSIGSATANGEAYIYELHELADATIIEEVVRNVKEASAKTQLEEIGRSIVADARNGKAAGEITETYIKQLLSLHQSGSKDARPIGEGVKKHLKSIERIRKGELTLPWAPHTQAVKDLYGHADEADFIILVGQPGSGKSSYMRHEAIETANMGEPVLTITLENTQEEALGWAAAKHAKINHNKISNPSKLSNAEWTRYQEAMDWVEKLPWYIADVGFSNISNIIALARRMAITKKPRLIQIDGMYLVQEKSKDGQYEIISSVAQGLRSLAQELKIPIMASTQFSRKVTQHKGVPELADLLYAGENPARSIWAIVKHEMSNKEAVLFPENKDNNRLKPEDNYGAQVARIKVMKNTGGETGWTGYFVWRKAFNDFQSLEPNWSGTYKEAAQNE